MEYACGDDKLYGILGQLAVITMFSADIGMAILRAVVPGIGNLLTSLGYSAAQDAIKTVKASKTADVWTFLDTTKTVVLAGGDEWLKKGLEFDKAGLAKPLTGALTLESIYSGHLAAADVWRKFQ